MQVVFDSMGRRAVHRAWTIDSPRLAELLDFYDRSRTEYEVLEDRNGNVVGLMTCGATPTRQAIGIQWMSVSPTLRSVVGFCRSIAIDRLVGSRLYVTSPGAASAGGTDAVDLGRHGDLPRFSPRDPFIVYKDPMTRRLHVDRLVENDR
jgi:hypothetical protein